MLVNHTHTHACMHAARMSANHARSLELAVLAHTAAAEVSSEPSKGLQMTDQIDQNKT